ncbi:ObirOr5-H1 [Ooceraea biroi]|uniref:Odorant receptor n=1 Tax=Ooceraea biroi TaxID=2015173 RepID=A0A3L8E1C5_OOCBI|nr:ObirOr5-H1 [Ooceraea biroi]
MMGKVTLDRVIAFLRVYLALACCWPLPPDATKFRRLCRRTLRYLCVANSTAIIVSGVWTISKHGDDVIMVMKIGCQMSAAVQVPLQIILFAMQDKRIKLIVFEIEDYYQRAQIHEKEILQYYVDKCKFLYGSILCSLVITAACFIFAPLFLPQLFPLDLEYPFDIYQPLQTIIYMHHILLVLQSATQVGANTFPALLLWFVAARFHILSTRFRTVTDMKQLLKCVYEHNILLRYAKEVTRVVRYVALLGVTCSTGAVIFGYLIFMSRQPVSVKFPFFMVTFSGFLELYMYAWPADNVMTMSSDIALAVYNSSWYKDDVAMRKIFMHVMRRSQRSVIVSVPGALPQLCIKYYATYTSAVFSYMAFIRIIIGQE